MKKILASTVVLLTAILFPMASLVQGEQDQALITSIYKDWQGQKKKPDFRTRHPSQDDFTMLGQHKCPHDGTPLLLFTLPAANSYTDIAKDAYFCKKESLYWVLQTHGTFRGTVKTWWGPFYLAGTSR
ncbi:hypothetical protein GMLC_04790 [Geomonas limicola]|uniref:Lipoprotein n=1 Tax=Geomonas limicola TaxID=2740186 RepID=A0A6V8N3G1_9BACT|nr:hypothetical protein [Geomonas limicola]GFO66900.1 hypothetical protein GMLC_04790 [Geomonas limicola]